MTTKNSAGDTQFSRFDDLEAALAAADLEGQEAEGGALFQGMERRSMNASGAKLSCAVRFTWALAGASSSSSFVSRSRPMVWSRRARDIANSASRYSTSARSARATERHA